MRALIADDEPHLVRDLQHRLARLWPELDTTTVAHDGVAAREALRELAPDLAFLDIRMPGLSGLEAARSAPSACRLVFVTAFDDHAVAAFELAAVDYLLKPVSDERLARCVTRLRQSGSESTATLLARLAELLPTSRPPLARTQGPLRWLRVQAGQELHLLPVEAVCYFRSSDKYTTVMTREREYLLRTPLKELLPRLDPAQFWQIHRGTVVNAGAVASARRDLLGRTVLVLRERPETLSVSRGYTHLFRQM
ncbi:MAG: hypothetical protein BWK76_07090 [Desulfobulbaceae bacterium A2]|nr:MAG: hypothetical protein BWK76_07090 [Desulfobulbaceae bacterium A2]